MKNERKKNESFINSFSDILKTQLTINVDCSRQSRNRKENGRAKSEPYKRHKNSLQITLYQALCCAAWHCYRAGSFISCAFAAEALIARYRGISNILSRERIRKRRRMDHYVTYSKSYYTGRYRGRKLLYFYRYLSHVRGPIINC